MCVCVCTKYIPYHLAGVRLVAPWQVFSVYVVAHVCVCAQLERERERTIKRQSFSKSDTCVTSIWLKVEIILIFHTVAVDICKITLWGLWLSFE